MRHPLPGTLPRPDFPFHLLLDDFEDAEDRAAAEAAVIALVDEIKEMMKRE
jgi:hypothetical protein